VPPSDKYNRVGVLRYVKVLQECGYNVQIDIVGNRLYYGKTYAGPACIDMDKILPPPEGASEYILNDAELLSDINLAKNAERLDTLVALLSHKNDMVKRNAVIAIGNLADKKALDPLISLLETEFRQTVLYTQLISDIIIAIGRTPDPKGLKVLTMIEQSMIGESLYHHKDDTRFYGTTQEGFKVVTSSLVQTTREQIEIITNALNGTTDQLQYLKKLEREKQAWEERRLQAEIEKRKEIEALISYPCRIRITKALPGSAGNSYKVHGNHIDLVSNTRFEGLIEQVRTQFLKDCCYIREIEHGVELTIEEYDKEIDEKIRWLISEFKVDIARGARGVYRDVRSNGPFSAECERCHQTMNLPFKPRPEEKLYCANCSAKKDEKKDEPEVAEGIVVDTSPRYVIEKIWQWVKNHVPHILIAGAIILLIWIIIGMGGQGNSAMTIIAPTITPQPTIRPTLSPTPPALPTVPAGPTFVPYWQRPTLLDFNVRLQAAHYSYDSLVLSQGENIHIELTSDGSGDGIEFLVLDTSNFNDYKKAVGGANFYWSRYISDHTVDHTYNFTAPKEDTYYFVMDNTWLFCTSPESLSDTSVHLRITN
jgi:hypothetical protein